MISVRRHLTKKPARPASKVVRDPAQHPARKKGERAQGPHCAQGKADRVQGRRPGNPRNRWYVYVWTVAYVSLFEPVEGNAIRSFDTAVSASLQRWNEHTGGDPRTDQVDKGDDSDPGLASRRESSLTANN